MKKISVWSGCCFLLVALFAAACSAQPANPTQSAAASTENSAPAAAQSAPQATAAVTAAATVETQATYSDPFSYCSMAGTIDAPDARYSGDAVPDAVINGYLKAAGLENNGEPLDLLRQTTTWRCMGGKVYACNIGANLPCHSKADTSQTPTQAMQDFCAADGNGNVDFIPMSVTGHTTIYSWRCVNGAPQLLDQIDQVDEAGYQTSIWYALTPDN